MKNLRNLALLVFVLLLGAGCESVQRAFQPVNTPERSPTHFPKTSEPELAEPEYEEPPIKVGKSKRVSVAEYAKTFVGTKYKYGGTTPRGFDCSGFTSYVYNRYGVSLPRTSFDQENIGRNRTLSKAQPGDLVFFRRTKVGKVFHVAIVVNNSSNGIEVVHSASSGVRIDNITTNSYWKTKNPKVKNVLGS